MPPLPGVRDASAAGGGVKSLASLEAVEADRFSVLDVAVALLDGPADALVLGTEAGGNVVEVFVLSGLSFSGRDTGVAKRALTLSRICAISVSRHWAVQESQREVCSTRFGFGRANAWTRMRRSEARCGSSESK